MKYPQILLITMAGIAMMGQGSRMIVEGILAERVYRPNTFDMIFDWSTLALMGMILFIWGTYLFYKEKRKRSHIYWNVECPECGYIHTDDIKRKDIECPRCHFHSGVDMEGFDTSSAIRHSAVPA